MPQSPVLSDEPLFSAPTDDTPTHDQWRALHKAAQAYRNISPWTYIHQNECFGVVDPATGSTWYLAVRGSVGEPYGLIAMNGPEALEVMERLSGGLPDESVDTLLDYADSIPEHDYVIVAFGDRTELLEDDLAIVRDLRLKYHGARDWPVFRSVRKHCIDWFVDATEVHVLTLALIQAVDVARRRRSQPNLLASEDGKLLVRTSESGAWTDSWREREPVAERGAPDPVAFPEELGEPAKALEMSDIAVELDYYWAGEIIGDGLLSPSHFERKMIVMNTMEDVCVPHGLPMTDFANQVAVGLVLATIEFGVRFAKVVVRKPELVTILGPTCDALGTVIELVEALPDVSEFRKGVGDHPLEALSQEVEE
jgi:hypothetical protein